MAGTKGHSGRKAGPGGVRSVQVGVRLTPSGMEAVDEMRGSSSRSEFVRGLIVAEYARRKR